MIQFCAGEVSYHMSINRIVPFLGAGLAASMACPTTAPAQVRCEGAVDTSYLLGPHEPCGFDHWVFTALVYKDPDDGQPIGVWLGPGGYYNACTGSYTDCSGQYHQNGQFWQGEKWMHSQAFPETEMKIWWSTKSRDLYMEGCVTPDDEQGWNPQLITWSWINGYANVYCN